MKQIAKYAAALAVVVLLALPALAESAATSELHVTVKDPAGAVVTNATVTMRDPNRNIERTVSQNNNGEYRFLLLPPGTYTVEVNAPGFATVRAPNVTVMVGQRAELPIALRVASTEQVENVIADVEMVSTQVTQSGNSFSSNLVANTPNDSRNYVSMVLRDPRARRDTAPSIGAAPTSGINIAGQRARSVGVNVDGLDAVDNSTNGVRPTVPQEAVQEFQVITSNYNAEYGRALGGMVNVITKSGTNDLHGAVFGYLRNRRFQATNPFSTVEDPAYTRVQAGASIGGPIIKDKTFYFFTFETQRRQEAGFSTIGQNNFDLIPFNTGAGTALLTQQQIDFIQANATNPAIAPMLPTYIQLAGAASVVALNGAIPGVGANFPGLSPTAPIGPAIPASYVPLNSIRGNFPVSEATDMYSLRLDHHFSQSQQINIRASVTPSTVTGIQVNAQGPQNFGQNAFSRTSKNDNRDLNIITQWMVLLSPDVLNEFRFQFARRGVNYTFSDDPRGGNVGVNIPGYAFFGREPFSYVRRTEKRWQALDHLAINKGSHNFKFGGDVHYIPVEARFSLNFGGLYNFGAVSPFPAPFPVLSPVQAYGLGLPQNFIQGLGNEQDKFSNSVVGLFFQDSWRLHPRLTMNYGVRYDVEFTPTFAPLNDLSARAEEALGITQGIPRDYNNFAPRIGLAWDPFGDSKTVVRAAYGMFYDHPLLGLAFNSDVADGTQAPQVVLFGARPSTCSPTALNATNAFQGTLGCLNALNFGYLPNEQRFDPYLPNSIWVNQNYLNAPTGPVPLVMQPFGFPVARDFEYAYSQQVTFAVERTITPNTALTVEYNFNGGRHLNRPINTNNTFGNLLVQNWQNAMADPAIPAAAKANFQSNPLLVDQCGVGPTGPYIPAAVASFFRPSGINPSIFPYVPAPCQALINNVLNTAGLGLGTVIPFSDMPANFSNGSSVYHGLTTTLRKRLSANYEFSAAWTWSHAIDDSTDLQSPLSPQDNFNPNAERSNSLFDQRHRFVFWGVINSGKPFGGTGFAGNLLSNWVISPAFEVGSGRPFNIITGSDRNFDFGTATDRPNAVPEGTATNTCGDPAVASKFSPTGFLQPACFLNGSLIGTLGRNAGTRPYTIFTDVRVSRRFNLTERFTMEGTVDMFNIINRFNVADVNPLYNDAGRATAAFDPRQLQFGLRFAW